MRQVSKVSTFNGAEGSGPLVDAMRSRFQVRDPKKSPHATSQRRRPPGAGRTLSGRSPARDDGRVLRRGHGVYILIESVEKPTDNSVASLFCCRVADADSSKRSARRCPRRISPHPSSAWGPRLLRRKYPVPVLRAGTGLSQQDPIPRQGAPRRGPRSRADVLTAWNRTRLRLRMAGQAFRRPKRGPQLEY
jgi:hypothetical protein